MQLSPLQGSNSFLTWISTLGTVHGDRFAEMPQPGFAFLSRGQKVIPLCIPSLYFLNVRVFYFLGNIRLQGTWVLSQYKLAGAGQRNGMGTLGPAPAPAKASSGTLCFTHPSTHTITTPQRRSHTSASQHGARPDSGFIQTASFFFRQHWNSSRLDKI